MKGTMAHAMAEIDRLDMPGEARNAMRDVSGTIWDAKRAIYADAQRAGEIAFYEAPQDHDGPDCLIVAIIAVKGGALVRLPLPRNVGASLAAEIVRKLV